MSRSCIVNRYAQYQFRALKNDMSRAFLSFSSSPRRTCQVTLMGRAQQYADTLLRPLFKREEQLALRISQLQRRLYAPDAGAQNEGESGLPPPLIDSPTGALVNPSAPSYPVLHTAPSIYSPSP